MKAAYLVGTKQIELMTIPDPVMANGNDVMVRVKCIGICGSDIHYYKEGRIGNQVVTGRIMLGHEVAGEVVETGKQATRFRKGDKVAIEPGISCGKCEQCVTGKPNLCSFVKFLGTPPIDGAMCEYLVMPEENIVKIPEPLGFEDGVLAEPLAIGLYGVRLSGILPGDDVAVMGAGPIGLSTLFSAVTAGAKRVFVSDLIDARLDAARKLGAEITVQAQKENISTVIAEATQGRGVDIAYEAAGQQATMHQVIESARIGGKSVIFGIPTDDVVTFESHLMRRKELAILNVRRSVHCTPMALELLAKSRLPFRRMVTHRFPLEKLQDALELVGDYRDGVIKAVVSL